MFESVGSWVSGALAVVALGLAIAAALPGERYGYADVGELLETYPRAAEVRQDIEAELAPIRAKLDEQRAATRAVVERLESGRETMSPQEQAVLQQKIVLAMQKQSELDAKFATLAKKLETERMEPVWKELDAGLQAFGQAEGYAMIWTATGSGNLAYASDAANVTDDLVAWMATHPPEAPVTPE